MWASDRITDANAVSGASECLSGTKVPPHSPRAGVMPRAKRMTESNHFSKNNGYSECPYARSAEGGLGSSLQYIGQIELLVSSGTALALLSLVGWRRGSICVLVVLLVSLCST